MGLLSTLLAVFRGVWDMGGNLRAIYEGSAESRQQREDKIQSLQRVIGFGSWVLAVMVFEAYTTAREERWISVEEDEGDSFDGRSSSSSELQRRPNSSSSAANAAASNYSFVSSVNPASS